MSTLLRRLDAALFRPVTPRRLALLRVALGVYGVGLVTFRGVHAVGLLEAAPSAFRPVGLLTPLAGPPGRGWLGLVVAVAAAGGVAVTLGWRYRVAAPLHAAALLVLLTFTNSYGQILHTDNLYALYVVALAFAPAADALSLDARRGRGPRPLSAPHGRYGWAVGAMCVVCVAAYFVAGVAKLRTGVFDFTSGELLRNQLAYDAVRKLEMGSVASPLLPFVLPHPKLFGVLGWGALAIELGAPLALPHRRLGAVWIAAAWSFHVGVLLSMAIVFPFQLTGLAFLPFLVRAPQRSSA